MPVLIPYDLPAKEILNKEKIFVMNETRAQTQDIRPLRVAIINLMPTKIETETQLLRMLSNTALQVNVDLIRTSSHESKNTSREHLEKFYKTFDEIRGSKYDAIIMDPPSFGRGLSGEIWKFEEKICEIENRVEELETVDICNQSITSCNLDIGDLVDACGNKPTTLAETLQLILDTLNTP